MAAEAAEGGEGGLGNTRFKSSTNRVPYQSSPGEEGESLWLRLELRLLADVGLVGLPNAGKSSLIAALTRAKPKIADYPFTTMSPHLGVLTAKDMRAFVLADIPGLIEGASSGAGLGLQFLKHIKRCRLLLHAIDLQTLTLEDPCNSYRLMRQEMRSYDPSLLDKKHVVVLNKSDTLPVQDAQALCREFSAGMHEVCMREGSQVAEKVLVVSAASYDGCDALASAIIELCTMNAGGAIK